MFTPSCAIAPRSTGGSRARSHDEDRRPARAQPDDRRAAVDRRPDARGCRGELRRRPLSPGAAVAGRGRASRRALAGRTLTHPAMPRAVANDLPDWLEPYLEAVYGRRLEDEMAALNLPAPLDLRVNALKTDRDGARRALAAEAIIAEPTPWSPLGLRLKQRAPLAGTSRLQGGARRGPGRGLAAGRAPRRRPARHAGRRFLRRRRRQDVGARRPDAEPRQARRLRHRGVAARARRHSGCAAPGSAMSSAARLRASATPGSSAMPRASTGCSSTRPASASAAGAATRTANGAPPRRIWPNSWCASATSSRARRGWCGRAGGSSTSPARCCARKTRRRPKPFSPLRPISRSTRYRAPGPRQSAGARRGGDDYLRLTPARHGTDGFFVAQFERRPSPPSFRGNDR